VAVRVDDPVVPRLIIRSVALNVDTAKHIRGPSARKALVEGIRNAESTDQETDWLEWKSQVTLSDKAWQGEIATHLIGFANRDPVWARRTVDGYAYLILGVEPGSLVGVEVVDPADLEGWIARYVGRTDGPRWEPHYVAVDDKSVLVITVAAPQQGDPIFSLRKAFQDPTGKTIPEGTVFVRRHGKTDRPSAADYDTLSRRAARVGAALSIEATWWDEPTVLRAVDLGRAAREEWLDRERRRLLAPLTKRKDFSQGFRAAEMFFSETRSQEEYLQQVERYIDAAGPALGDEVLARAVASGINRLQLAVENLTEHNFEQVAVELHVPGDVAAFFDADEAATASEFPRRPLLWGTRRSLLGDFVLEPTPMPRHFRVPPGRIDNAASARIAFNPIHIRPEHRHALPPFHVIVLAKHAGRSMTAAWAATSTSVSGTVSGEFEMEVAAETMPIADVMARKVQP
jgi:hypothetical protein